MRRFNKFTMGLAATSLVLAGCGDDGGTGSESDTGDGGTKIGVAYDVGGRGDLSFNDSAYAGVEKAAEDFDAEFKEVEAARSERDTDREERLRLLADAGYNPILAVGFVYTPAVATVSAEYPDTEFAVVDGYATFVTGDMVEIDNVTDLNFASNEGSFLVGVAAALTTKTKNVGFLGGVNGPLIQSFEAGFKAGVAAVDDSIEIQTEYLSQDDPSLGFENPSGGETAGTGMYENGADVVYHAAGKSGLGLFDAVVAAGKGKWAIGVDSDQYETADPEQQPYILTSMLKRIDVAVYEYIQAFDEGEAPQGVALYDLKVDGVGYSTSGDFLSEETISELDGYAEQIKSGELEVPTAP